MDGKASLLVIVPSPVFCGLCNSCLSKECGIVSNTVSINAAAKTYLITLFIGCDTKECLGSTGYINRSVLDEIIKIGSSEVPDITTDTHPDDDIEDLYIKARINILAWAKRTQNWNLK